MPSPSVCVIGAGLSGLATGKALGDHGIAYDCFEMSDRIGGNWAFKNPNGRSSAYRSLHIDTSKNCLAFADLPMPDDYPDFPHHTEIAAYFDRYADTFGLREHIRFRTEVTRAERRAGGGWRVALSDGDVRDYDALVVCNGHHWDPRLPDPPFPGHFDGEQIHSHHYIDPTDPVDCMGKKVLVVGIGNSAVDIASELSRKGVAEKAFLSTRRGAYVIPKYLFGKPLDQVVKTNPRIPLKLQRRLGQALIRLVVGDMTDYGLPKPDHRLLEAHPTVSSELLLRLGSGDLRAKPNIAELRGDRVAFVDGSEEEVDVIVYATGYRITFPFFDEAFLSAPDNRLPLFKRVFKPGLPDLAFVGLAQALPTLFPFVECQAKWVGAYFAGEYALPAEHEMHAAIAHDEAVHNKHFVGSPRHTMQVDYYVYVEDLAREEAAGRERARLSAPAVAA